MQILLRTLTADITRYENNGGLGFGVSNIVVGKDHTAGTIDQLKETLVEVCTQSVKNINEQNLIAFEIGSILSTLQEIHGMTLADSVIFLRERKNPYNLSDSAGRRHVGWFTMCKVCPPLPLLCGQAVVCCMSSYF